MYKIERWPKREYKDVMKKKKKKKR